MFRCLLPLVFLSVLGSASPCSAASPGPASSIPVEHFLDMEAFGNLKISPDGKYLAATVPHGDRNVLVVLRRQDMKQTAAVNLEKNGIVSGFWWANNHQLLYKVATRHGPLDHPVSNPFLYMVDVDGDPRAVNKHEPMWLIDRLEDDEHHILVSLGSSRRYGVGRVDLRTGKIKAQKVSWPAHANSTYYLDNAAQVRGVRGYMNNEMYPRLWVLDGAGEWQETNNENAGDEAQYIVGFSADNSRAYLMAERRTGTDEFLEMDLATLETRPLLRNPRVDAFDTLTSPVHGGVIAVVYLDGKPKLEFVAPDDRHALELKKLAKAFPNAYVYPTSYALDGELGVYQVSSDLDPGEYYLVDHANGKAHFLAARSERLDPRQMSPTQVVRFKARDGLEIEGFLTVPRDRPAGTPGPLVVMPHGGPIGVFDRWGFDSEVQLLASRGYAVLKVNFRGSGNYGKAFREAGHRQWGGRMQDDLTDATRWTIAQGIAAPGRICLYGSSYGAYASMMGLIREPDLYACGIGNVGVYDMPQLYREESVGSRFSRTYMDEVLGSSDLASISPPSLARAIRVPVLLGAGGDDRTAPPHHTRSMRRALHGAGVPVEMKIYGEEGHGYFDKANQLDWANRVLGMLDRTIGSGRAADSTAATP